MPHRFLILLFLLLIAGCRDAPSKSTVPLKPLPSHSVLGKKSFTQDGVEAKISSWTEVQSFVKTQKGKIVVIDVWSTWCDPCMQEYPHLVALQKKYPEQVVCISFNVNYDGSEDSPPEASKQVILDFLVKQQSKLINIISNVPSDEFYDVNDLGSIPVVYVYNSDSTLNKIFQESKEYGDDGFSYKKQITPLVDKLVKKMDD